MGIFDVIAKRVERRALREMENAATKKLKGLLFGKKDERVELHPLVEYRRLEIGLLDLLGCYDNRELCADWSKFMNSERTKKVTDRLKSIKHLYSGLLTSDLPLTHKALVDRLEAIL